MNYCPNLQKTIDYIEEHIKSDINIESAIQESGYSITHFYRIFQAVAGESIKEYINHRRLSNAAYEIATTPRRILDIAVDYGFNSQEVFTRAFSRFFHTTPAKYRKGNEGIEISAKLNVEQKVFLASEKHIDPVLMLEKDFHFVGIERTVIPGNTMISKVWEEFHARKHEIKNVISDHSFYGICEYIPDITDESQFRYLACYEVSNFSSIPAGMTALHLPLNKYAVFSHRGSLDTLKETYDDAYGVWLPLSPYRLAEMDTFELYTEKGLDIYIPIR